MVDFAKEVVPVNIEDEMRNSYMDYAMSVIVGRALPDARDGLKPVHRRVLYTMAELGNDWNKPYKKSARIVGEVMGKYHPHGDNAIYDTLVRMAQPFSLRYMLVDGQGNFGSVDGDAPAAMRYTEVRMAKIAHQLLADIDKETVDFVPNYDDSEREPSVFPTLIPNLLVNGSSGIAVGMATNIPSHNLAEVIDACIALMESPELPVESLMEHIPGPDFPTAAIINGANGIREAYLTGRGRIYVRSRTNIEAYDDGERIVVTELPYQVNKARLQEKIAALVNEKKIEGIREIRDESDKDGMRLVIELRRGEPPEVVLNNLFQQTQMQTVFGINMVALQDGYPRLLNLKQMLECFLRHRREVVTRRTIFELRKARERGHILEGQAVALANIDPVIALIKSSSNPPEAKERLLAQAWTPGAVTAMIEHAGAAAVRPDDLAPEYGLHEDGYRLSPVQAQAILDMRLHRLTGLEQEKIFGEYKGLLGTIEGLINILCRPDRLMEVMREELLGVKEAFGDARRTEILDAHLDLTLEDLITEEDVVVTMSHSGYVKAQPLAVYRSQRRGGRGKTATTVKDEDFIDQLFIANTHDTMLCFSSSGKLYWLKVFEIPQASRAAKGKPIINLLPLKDGERITAVLPVRTFRDGHYVIMVTARGTIKKCQLNDFSRPRNSGIIALDLPENDRLVGVELTDGNKRVMLFSSSGKAICFSEDDVRAMGRLARGVRGIRLRPGQEIIAMIIAEPDTTILAATENGFGKRTPIADFPTQGRGGQGVIAIQTTERNGSVIGAVPVTDEEEVMLISDQGTLVRTPAKDISVVGRNTQGVRLINLAQGEKLVGIERVIEVEEHDDDRDND